jgi:hypothetical protein
MRFRQSQRLGVIPEQAFQSAVAVVQAVFYDVGVFLDVLKMAADIIFRHDQAAVANLGQIFFAKILRPVKGDVAALYGQVLPVLDGGRVLLFIIEAIRRKPLNPKIESAIMTVSMVFVLLLMVLVAFKDLFSIF